MCYSLRLMRPLSKVETRRDSSFAVYIAIINRIDEQLMLITALLVIYLSLSYSSDICFTAYRH